MSQGGRCAVFHLDQIVGVHAAGQVDRLGRRVGVIEGGVATGPCVEIDKEIAVAIPVRAQPVEPERRRIPGNIERLRHSIDHCPSRNSVITRHQRPATVAPAAVAQGDEIRCGWAVNHKGTNSRHLLITGGIISDKMGVDLFRLANRLAVTL